MLERLRYYRLTCNGCYATVTIEEVEGRNLTPPEGWEMRDVALGYTRHLCPECIRKEREEGER